MKMLRAQVGLGVLALVFLAITVVASGCGGAKATEVTVSLKEWSVAPNVAQAKAGKLTFVVTNGGSRPHEFVVIKSDAPPTSLPVVEGKVDEDKVSVIDEIKPFAAGATEKLTLNISAGKYVLICNIVERPPGQPVESHYQMGMTVAFTISQ